MTLPNDVKKIIKILNEHGHGAYVVGGCVRDNLMGIEPSDWDVATSAAPNEVKKLFGRTVDTGIKHGTVAVVTSGSIVEVTTYRIDGPYHDGRRPSEVFFTGDLASDLKRRDFTMNAIAYHPETGYADPWGGADDIDKKIIRGVGDADLRFKEDALRMLRAVRFSAATGFIIERATSEAIAANAGLIKFISKERIRDELIKTITAKHPERLTLLVDYGLAGHIHPGLDAYLKKFVGVIAAELKNCEDFPALRLALFFRFAGAEFTNATMRALRFGNRIINAVAVRSEWIDKKIEPDGYSVKKALSILGPGAFDDVIKLKEIAENNNRTNTNILSEIKNRVTNDAECYSLNTLAVTGADIISHTGLRGSEIGEALRFLLDEAMKDPGVNNKKTLLTILSRAFSSPPRP